MWPQIGARSARIQEYIALSEKTLLVYLILVGVFKWRRLKKVIQPR